MSIVLIALGLVIVLSALVVAVLVLRAPRRRPVEESPAAAVEPWAAAAAVEPAAAAVEPPAAGVAMEPAARAVEPPPGAKQEADLVDVKVTRSDAGAVVELANLGSQPIRDVVLSEVTSVEHPDWAWRPAETEANNESAWWLLRPGESARCCVELLDRDGRAQPAPTTSPLRVQAFWSDLSGSWWVLTAEGPKTPSETRTDAEVQDLPRLTSAEDSELRQLTWFASFGQLSEEAQARLDGLKARDRRAGVRDARPDPASRHGDEAGPRLAPAAARSARCGHCGYEAEGDSIPTFCPGCGERLATAQASG